MGQSGEVTMDGNVLKPTKTLKNGYYPVHIRVEDASGNVDDTIIVLHVKVPDGDNFRVTIERTDSSSQTVSKPDGPLEVEVTPRTPGTILPGDIDTSGKDFDTVLNQYYSPDGSSSTFTPSTRNTYPGSNVPSGPVTGSLPNSAVINISNSQAPTSQSPKNVITADDIKIRAASERVQNAVKAITNLLDIIRKANANRAAAEVSVRQHEDAYNKALAEQKAINNDIEDLEATHRKLQQAINSADALISQLRGDVNSIQGDIDAAIADRDDLVARLKDRTNARDQILFDIDQLKKENDALQKKLDDENGECKEVNDEAADKTDERNDLLISIAGIDDRLKASADNVQAKDDRVAELERLLAQARKDADDARKAHNDLVAFEKKVAEQINILNKVIADLLAKCDVQAYIEGIKNNEKIIRDKTQGVLKTTNADIDSLNNLLSNANDKIKRLQDKLADVKSQLDDTIRDLVYLREQIPDLEGRLRDAYLKGNAAISRTNRARQAYEAAVARYEQEDDTLRSATRDLEQARIEQAEANTAYDILLEVHTDALPYPIAPTDDGLDGASGNIFDIDDFNSYIRRAYGDITGDNDDDNNRGNNRGDNRGNNRGNRGNNGFTDQESALLGLIRRLIRFGSSGGVRRDCSTSGNEMSNTGKILDILNNGNWLVDTDHGKEEVDTSSSCGLKVANVFNYEPKQGDRVFWKGLLKSGIWESKHVTCVRE